MHRKFFALLDKISLTQQFMLVSLVILILSTIGLGWWVSRTVEMGVTNRIAAEKALFVNSFIHPALEDFITGKPLNQKDIDALNRLVENSRLGDNVVAFKIWDLHGKLIYSTNPVQIGQTYPLNENLARAMEGNVVSSISNLADDENVQERGRWHQLLETYSPVTRSSSSEIIAVVEFYQTIDDLKAEIMRAQQSSWLVMGAATLLVFSILSIFVQRASNTIDRQRRKLTEQVTRLTELLAQNAELHERVRRATSRSAELNERILRRIGAELHDGPAQDLGYALLRLDGMKAEVENSPSATSQEQAQANKLNEIESSLQHAMKEIRAISSGMGLPELKPLSLAETVQRVVSAHQRRTGTTVEYSFEGTHEKGSLSTKIIVYRLVQEALNNSFRHAGGQGQAVWVTCSDREMCVEVSDRGPGFDVHQKIDQDVHLGLSGIQDRVNSLGGEVSIESTPGKGTLISSADPAPSGGFFSWMTKVRMRKSGL